VAPSILKMPWLSFTDRVRTLWGAWRLVRKSWPQYEELDQYTSYEYGMKMGYSENGILSWNSASLGLTNLFVQEQSATLLAGKHRVLIGTENGLAYQLPAGNLTHLFGLPAHRMIEKLGGRVLVGAKAVSLTRQDGQTRVQLENGETLVGEHVIVAMQPWHARELVPWVNAPWTELQPVTPVITSVFGLDGRLASSTDARELGCSREQWSFSVITDLSRFWPEYAGDKTVLRVEIGHADLLPGGVNMPEPLLLEMVKHDLDRLYPDARPRKVEWAALYREQKHLYVKWTRGEFAKKIKERDVGRGVYLAGDWTSKGTIGMEAAANSGLEAANHVLATSGKPLIQFTDVPLD
jgi:protoporphyrinogen oxidase